MINQALKTIHIYSHFRMRKTIFILAIVTCICEIIGINLQPDNESEGLVFKPYKKIHVQSGTEYLTCEFNISTLNFINDNMGDIIKKCPNKKMKLDIYSENINQNIPNRLVKNATSTPVRHIEILPPPLLSLQSMIKHFKNNNCETLDDIIAQIEEIRANCDILGQELQRIYYFIEKGKFQADVLGLTIKPQTTIPYGRTIFFLEIEKYVKTNYQFANNSITIEFELPVFDQRRTTLFAVYAKPVIYNGDAYLFNTTDMSYAVLDSQKTLTLSESEYTQNCHISGDSHFCKTENLKLISCFFDIQLGISAFITECFTKIKNQNMITQIGKSLYFTIFSPMDLHLMQNKAQFTIPITYSSKIVDKIKYNISTSFFSYFPCDDEKYEIFVDDTYSETFFTHKFSFDIKRYTAVTITFTVTATLSLLYLIIRLIKTN